MTLAAGKAPPTQRPLVFRTASRTHVGLVRQRNEDCLLARPEAGLWAVADGMGGHRDGDVASAMAMEGLDGAGAFSSGYAYLTDVCERLQRANRDLIARAAATPPGDVIATTVVVLIAYEDHFACVWAGDSRAYLLRDGRLRQITHDHSLVQELVDSGALTSEGAKSHRRGNIVTRALGVSERLDLDLHDGAIQAGDLFLLCSDGLTGMLPDAEIAEIMRAGPLELTADALVDRALQRGARDNVSLVLVAAEGPLAA